MEWRYKKNKIKEGLGAHEFLFNIVNLLKDKDIKSLNKSQYFNLGNGITLRVSDHYANPKKFKQRNNLENNYGIVVKLSNNKFYKDDDVNYTELVYFQDLLNKDRQIEIIKGLKSLVITLSFRNICKVWFWHVFNISSLNKTFQSLNYFNLSIFI